ncbi:AfsR/SARP family transcriptional regulator [Micromonospora sp. DT201]|uniref:AfsR/SARP family transcriptional regulator n=1 Tax=Micromonospora sp. DT201 TaxID=3393442 RepID=UPI003CED1777
MGPLEIRDGGELIFVRASKQRALIALLALRAGGAVSLAELYAALWDEDLPVDPKAAVHYVRRLRRLLSEEVIATTANGYRFAVDREHVDLHQIRALVAEAQTCCQAIAVCERHGQGTGRAAAQALLGQITAEQAALTDPGHR